MFCHSSPVAFCRAFLTTTFADGISSAPPTQMCSNSMAFPTSLDCGTSVWLRVGPRRSQAFCLPARPLPGCCNNSQFLLIMRTFRLMLARSPATGWRKRPAFRICQFWRCRSRQAHVFGTWKAWLPNKCCRTRRNTDRHGSWGAAFDPTCPGGDAPQKTVTARRNTRGRRRVSSWNCRLSGFTNGWQDGFLDTSS